MFINTSVCMCLGMGEVGYLVLGAHPYLKDPGA